MASPADSGAVAVAADGADSVVVAYHWPCPDGAFGALAAHLALSARGAAVRWAPLQVFRPEAERIATLAASLAPRDTLYLIDITGGAAFIAACCARARRVVVLDHHMTGAEDLAQPALAALPNLETHFDMARSGATMARDHFGVAALLEGGGGGGAAEAARVLRLFALIEDNDLYRHALIGSKEFAAGFHALGLDLDATKRGGAVFGELLALDADAVIARGREALVEQERIVDEELEGAFAIDIAAPGGADAGSGGPLLSCLAVLTRHPDLRSQQGNKLAALSVAAGFPAAGAVVYEEESLGAETWKVSLRSVGDVDTTRVTKAWGGGGHANASSCNVARSVFEEWRRRR